LRLKPLTHGTIGGVMQIVVVVAIFASLLSLCATQSCSPGLYFHTGTGQCEDCPVGFYCPGTSQRIACPIGTSTQGKGAIQSEQCLCAPGYFMAGKLGCKTCDPDGTVYKDTVGDTECSAPCPAFSKTYVAGALSPDNCVCEAGYEKVVNEGTGEHRCVASKEEIPIPQSRLKLPAAVGKMNISQIAAQADSQVIQALKSVVSVQVQVQLGLSDDTGLIISVEESTPSNSMLLHVILVRHTHMAALQAADGMRTMDLSVSGSLIICCTIGEFIICCIISVFWRIICWDCHII